MPPKKTVKKSDKDKAAELKKKNTAIAKDIIATVMRQSKVSSASDKTDDGVSTDKSIEKAPLKKTSLRMASSLKNESSNEPMASTSKTCSGSKQSATSSNTSTSVSTFDIFSGIVESSVQESGKTRAVRKRKINETNEGAVKRIAHDVHNVPVIASPKNQSISNIPKSETSTHHVARSANLFKYIYEINCERVADNVNVSELQKYLQEQLKVGGVKNNLAGNITIDCQGHKVSIKSKLYLPKKSLRFLSKKFLKKQWNIQVVSKSSHAYEFKYVGTP